MKKINLMLIALLAVFSSCSSDFNEAETETNAGKLPPEFIDPYVGDAPTSIYTGGGFQGFTYAFTYLNGVPTQLDGSLNDIEMTSMFVENGNGDVYSAGYYQGYATVWKNNLIYAQYPGGKALSIAISGGDLYVVGYKYTGDLRPVLWKNGVETILPFPTIPTATMAIAHSVSVVGSTVCIVGQINNKASLWINGVLQTSLSTVSSDALSVVCNGTKAYIAGYEFNATTGKNKAVRWTKTIGSGGIIKYNLSAGTTDAQANSIAYDSFNDIVYTAGYEQKTNNYTGYRALLWQNNTKTVLTENGTARAIATFEGHVYVGGDSDSFTSGTIWEDGVPTQGNPDTRAISLY